VRKKWPKSQNLNQGAPHLLSKDMGDDENNTMPTILTSLAAQRRNWQRQNKYFAETLWICTHFDYFTNRFFY
jgi:hypothetical protein